MSESRFAAVRRVLEDALDDDGTPPFIVDNEAQRDSNRPLPETEKR
jgi:hypothetical protein